MKSNKYRNLVLSKQTFPELKTKTKIIFFHPKKGKKQRKRQKEKEPVRTITYTVHF